MNFTEEMLTEYLEAEADLDAFFVMRAANMKSGMVHYVDREGADAWVLMEDNDELVAACIKFLIDRGNPVFSEPHEENAHVKELKKRYSV